MFNIFKIVSDTNSALNNTLFVKSISAILNAINNNFL
jgi:hypothetical protein